MFARNVRDPVTGEDTTIAEQTAVRHDLCDFDDMAALPIGDLVQRATDASVLSVPDTCPSVILTHRVALALARANY